MHNKREASHFGLSLKVVVAIMIVIILFGLYIGVLLYGENSLSVLNDLKRTEKRLLKEAQDLKNENQRLQKESFELKQLSNWEE